MKGRLIGSFVNRWRGRRVLIFEDTADRAMVYTSGESLDTPTAAPVETHEPRTVYDYYIGTFAKVYE